MRRLTVHGYYPFIICYIAFKISKLFNFCINLFLIIIHTNLKLPRTRNNNNYVPEWKWTRKWKTNLRRGPSGCIDMEFNTKLNCKNTFELCLRMFTVGYMDTIYLTIYIIYIVNCNINRDFICN